MTESFVVEVWGKPAGVVLREGAAFRFHAIAAPFFAIDGARFNTPGHARLAAARLGVGHGREDDKDDGDHSDATDRSLGKASHWASSLPL